MGEEVRAVRTSSPAFDVNVEPHSESFLQQAARRFLRHRLAMGSLVLLLLICLVAVFAPELAPHNPYISDVTAFGAPPSAAHPLGTDLIGRDVMSRMIYAARVSVAVGLGSSLIFVVIGTVLGALAGYYGGGVDMVIMRFADLVLAFPSLVLVLVIAAILGPSLTNIILILGFLGWPTVARLVRASYLAQRHETYVEAARAGGLGDFRIGVRHMLPNAMGPMLVAGTFGAATSILAEAGLSFLGLGVQPPTASWGNMLSQAQSLSALNSMPWLWLPPGLAILVTVLAINFLGDGIRDAFDVKTRSA